MSFHTYVGWDIGGAHLKVAVINQSGTIERAMRLPTPLWQGGIEKLSNTIRQVHAQIDNKSAKHAITMTAELSDIFIDRATGVRALMRMISDALAPQTYYFYAGKHGLIKPDCSDIDSIASANWHATATFSAQNIDNGILIDIGSTTTDIIPFTAGKLTNIGYSDHQRLRNNELIYTGITRTPVMSLVNKIFFNGQWQNIIAENFSTMSDIYCLTGQMNQQDDLLLTADSAEKTPLHSARRLARMLGLDMQQTDDIQAMVEVAKYIADQQLQKIQSALLTVLSRPQSKNIRHLIGAGNGSFLTRELASKNDLHYIDFTNMIDGAMVQQHNLLACATAVSVAQIARATT